MTSLYFYLMFFLVGLYFTSRMYIITLCCRYLHEIYQTHTSFFLFCFYPFFFFVGLSHVTIPCVLLGSMLEESNNIGTCYSWNSIFFVLRNSLCYFCITLWIMINVVILLNTFSFCITIKNLHFLVWNFPLLFQTSLFFIFCFIHFSFMHLLQSTS